MSRALPQPPALRAVKVPGIEGTAGHVALWCPWCEKTHRHGAAGGGLRAAHCHDSAASPLSCTGYDLDVIGSAASERAVVPAALMVGNRRLVDALAMQGPSLSNWLVRRLLGLARAGDDVASKHLAKGAVWVLRNRHWIIERPNGERSEGEGLLRLAAELYGVSPGVAAVRVLEATTAEQLDAEAAFAVQRAIDDWASCGAPKRGGRR